GRCSSAGAAGAGSGDQILVFRVLLDELGDEGATGGDPPALGAGGVERVPDQGRSQSLPLISVVGDRLVEDPSGADVHVLGVGPGGVTESDLEALTIGVVDDGVLHGANLSFRYRIGWRRGRAAELSRPSRPSARWPHCVTIGRCAAAIAGPGSVQCNAAARRGGDGGAVRTRSG